MKLFFRKYGETGIPVIIIHGLYGSGDNWVSIARGLAESFEVYTIDQRNHGQSTHSDEHNYEVLRDDLLEFLDQEEIEKAILIGHSMGGKTAIWFADEYPERVQSLISIDIAPKAYHRLSTDSHFVADHTGMIDAMLDVDLAGMKNREQIDRVLSGRIGSDRIRSFLMKNIRRGVEGEFEWKINLQAFRNNLDRILDAPDIEQIIDDGGITGFPVLFIAGERSDYISPEDSTLIRSVFPTAEIVTIPNAGHWVHAEQPDLLLKNIKYFLAV